MRSALFLLSILVISSCTLLNDSDTKEAEQLIPLEVGNSWAINTNRSNGEIHIDTLSVSNDTLIGDKTWYKLESNSWLLDQNFNGFYRNHKNGLYKYSGSEEVTENTLLLGNTNSLGETFTTDSDWAKWVTVYIGEIYNDSLDLSTKNTLLNITI